jgi:uncharacterized membrane protein YgcG
MIRSVFFGLAAVVLIGAAPADLKPKGYVNDFANIIPDEREAVIENKLADFEKVTTMEIAVVTTPSLDGRDVEGWSIELARAWGVGKKGNDNGILFTIAPNERTYRIETGYGVEPFLTDGVAGRFGRDILPDYFRANDYGGGTEALVDKIIAHIGMLSPADQKQLIVTRVQQAEKERYEATIAKAMFFERLGNFIGGLIVLALLVFGFFRLRRFIKRRREENRKLLEMKEFVRTFEVDIAAQVARFNENPLSDESYRAEHVPAWMAPSFNFAFAIFSVIESDAKAVVSLVPPLTRKHLPAIEKSRALIQGVSNAGTNALLAVESFEENVTQYRKGVEDTVATTAKASSNLARRYKKLVSSGCMVDFILTKGQLTEFASRLNELQRQLASRGQGRGDASDKVKQSAEALTESILDVAERLKDFDALSNQAVATFEALDKELPGLAATQQRHADIMKRLAVIIPATRLNTVRFDAMDSEIKVVTREFGTLEVREARDAALVVSFYDKLSTLKERAEAVTSAFVRAEELERETLSAREAYREAASKLERAIAAAGSEVNDSDVEDQAKQLLHDAKNKQSEAANIASKSLVDWIAVSAFVETALALANQAKQEAESDKEEAARRRRRRAAAQSSASYGSSNHSSSSSPSGGFKGFGGGGFGGGGASGRW